ncbi:MULTISPECIES: phosphatase PAP2 family protein [Streptomyces]|uniref:phosphatase PAP2 family protein n=1 Tax=Streptomyces TaxID=1883 RepID=UPI00163CFD10|nr:MULTISPECIES: phosphatase PAP2 family protein [Streptomyces]MBC2873848.1 phosphatase PAP2 family protein [Streptomyces sp. TYQ1024]UBI39205.1 phosphatase PAP2 family protein [Streptomyces mobaraensis]UKW31787.1 phosphatase PAP2 family protein [Streptomyces sp. TYQ1024]
MSRGRGVRAGVSPVRAGIPAAAALLGLLVLAVLVLRHGRGGFPVDVDVRAWALAHRPAVGVAAARAVTATGTGPFPYLLALLAGWLAVRGGRRRKLWAAGAAVTVLACGQAVRYAVLESVARPRPPVDGWATHADGWSFPSGHTSTSAIAAGLVAAAVLLRSRRAAGPVVAVAGCWAVAVGLSRAYLGVHWFTDVVGGWLFATVWLGACACAALRLLPGTRYGSVLLDGRRDGDGSGDEGGDEDGGRRRGNSEAHRPHPPLG